MIRRPPRSTLFPYHDALPIWTFRQTALLRRGPRTHVGSRTRPPREEFTMGPFPHDAPAARITPQNPAGTDRSEEHTSELQSRQYLVCRLLLEKKKKHNLRSRH